MKHVKKLLFPLTMIALVAIISCNKNDDDPPEKNKKVAMLAQGFTFDDMSFLQSCKTGMEQAKTDFSLDVTYNIDTVSDQYQQRIDQFGD